MRRKVTVVGAGATGAALADYLMATLQDPALEEKWQGYQPQAKVA